jgi:hypothetical protein
MRSTHRLAEEAASPEIRPPVDAAAATARDERAAATARDEPVLAMTCDKPG